MESRQKQKILYKHNASYDTNQGQFNRIINNTTKVNRMTTMKYSKNNINLNNATKGKRIIHNAIQYLASSKASSIILARSEEENF